MRHVLQQQLLVFHVRQLAPFYHGLLGEGLEREVFYLPQVGLLLLCSVEVITSSQKAARTVVDGWGKPKRQEKGQRQG